jgi:hypothetical protein
MEVNSVVNDIARPVGDVSVRKVTNELDWVTEIGCGGSTKFHIVKQVFPSYWT